VPVGRAQPLARAPKPAQALRERVPEQARVPEEGPSPPGREQVRVVAQPLPGLAWLVPARLELVLPERVLLRRREPQVA
jgi:hypothetical protein